MEDAMLTRRFDIRTNRRDELVDITEMVAGVVAEARLADGIATVYVPHTTASVTINENADRDVVHDVLEVLDVAVPWRQDFYRHNEGNSAAHVKSSLMGCSATIPILEGKLALGVWQAVYFAEFDGPRVRSVIVTVNG